ncbi:MAG TPA: LuxR C-terminal-related transcriptional regulator [Gemmatimonadales bacterium]
MNPEPTEIPDRDRESVAAGTAEDLADLLASLRELRDEGWQLITRLRETLQETRSARAAAIAAPADRPPPERRGGPSPTHLRVHFGMTQREAEVAKLLEEGCANLVIARRLGISPHTARHHTQRVLAKLGVHSRSEAGARLRQRSIGGSAYGTSAESTTSPPESHIA